MKITQFPIYSSPTLQLSIKGGISSSVDSPQSLFEIKDFVIAQKLRCNVSQKLTDFLQIALYVYCADQLFRRERHWCRRLGVKIPVQDPKFWEARKYEILELLQFLTDDEWILHFVPAPPVARRQDENPFLPIHYDPQSIVALYSGGLDSFAGLANQLSANPGKPFVLVASSTNSRQVNLQRAQINELRRQTGRDLTLIQVWSSLKKEALGNGPRETSQRTRGFLHLALGVVTALSAGLNRLCLYENGIGAINLPYDGTHVGALATHAVHPGTLRRMAELVQKITDEPFEITNPFIFQTKGQMVATPEIRRFANLIGKTFSCDGFPLRQHAQSQCGTCTSCILRRLSIEVAGLSNFDPGHTYDTDCTSEAVSPTKQLSLSRLKMEYQVRAIAEALSQPDPWNAMVQEFPRLCEIFDELTFFLGMNENLVETALLDLYRSYVAEWNSFSGRSRQLQGLAKAA